MKLEQGSVLVGRGVNATAQRTGDQINIYYANGGAVMGAVYRIGDKSVTGKERLICYADAYAETEAYRVTLKQGAAVLVSK